MGTADPMLTLTRKCLSRWERTRLSKGIPNQVFQDYWAVGPQLTILFVDLSFELHLSELLDAVTGLIGFDFLYDDVVSRESLELDREQREDLVNLIGAFANDYKAEDVLLSP